MGIFDTMPPDWNSEGMKDLIPDKAPAPDSGITAGDADPGMMGAPPDSSALQLPQEGETNAVQNLQQDLSPEGLAARLPGLDPQVQAALAAQLSASSKSSVKQGTPDSDDKDNPAVNPSQKDYLKDLISKVYGSDLGDDAIKAAMAKRDQLHNAGIDTLIGSELAAAMSKGSYKPNNLVAEQMLKEANQPVQDIATRRAAKMQEMEAGLKASDLVDKEKLRDPDSNVSQAYRNMALQLNPKLADQDGFESMNAEGVKQLMPMVDMSIRMQFLQLQKQQALQAKVTQDSGKAKSDMGKTIQTVMNRGAPMQAQQSVLSADKIMDLFKDQPDPGLWDSDQVHLFRTETEKLAKGGTPSEGGTKALIPPTIASTFAKVATGITGNKVGTDQGNLIRNLVPYIQNVRQTSADYVRNNVYNPIMNSYNKRLTPEDLEDYKSSVPDYIFPERQAAANNKASLGATAGQPSQSNGGPQVGSIQVGASGQKYKYTGGDPSKKSSWEAQ